MLLALQILFGVLAAGTIPGTLNIGDTFPVIFEAFIFTASVDCDPMFLWIMYICAAVGSFGFATIVTKWPRNKIRYALGFIMIPLAIIMLCKNTGVGPFGAVGTATGLTGWKLIVAAGLNILWGALMDIGFGLYAPCMATCLLLGVDGTACFPVFMGSSSSRHTDTMYPIQSAMRSADVSVYSSLGSSLQTFRCSG